MHKGLYFVCGAAIGSLTTWLAVKDFYKKRAQEEIDSVKTTRRRNPIRTDTSENANKRAVTDENKAVIMDYSAKLKKLGYSQNTDVAPLLDREEKAGMSRPYIIAPHEFGEFEDYEKISLTYYSDGVLADDDDEVVDDVGETVGEDFANGFGQYEDDSVFIRNDERCCDYEILRDERSYSDVTGNNPHLQWSDNE